jgi:hypothetical protein
MSKVDLVVWSGPARAVCEVIMTKFSCFALAAADMKHVQQVESRLSQLAFRSPLLDMWATRGPLGRLPKSLCDFGDMTPLTRSSVELRPPSRAQGPAFGRIIETTQGGPGDLEGTPPVPPPRGFSPVRGVSQGPSGRHSARGTPPDSMHTSTAREGLTPPRRRAPPPEARERNHLLSSGG